MKCLILLITMLLAGIAAKGQTNPDSLFLKRLQVKIQKIIEFNLMGVGYVIQRDDAFAIYPQQAADKRIKYTALNYGDLLDFKVTPLILPVFPDTTYLYYTVDVEMTTENELMLKSTGVTTNVFFMHGRRYIVIVHNVDPLRFTLLQKYIYDYPYYEIEYIFDAYKRQGFNKDNVYSYLYFVFYSEGLKELTFEKEDETFFYYEAEFGNGEIKQLLFDKAKDCFHCIKEIKKKP